jgi:ABC-type transporter Mla subunit MlaD
VRRLLAICLVLAAAAAVLVGASGREAGEANYRVDAVFDRTAALIPGQKVKIAGAPVGMVKDIGLTRARKARVEMEVQEGFAPFRADARCTIRAEALIGEKFVQCDPGTPRKPALREGEGGVPTVPLARNTVPVEIDTILATFRRPYRERFRILLNEFGIGLAGRAGDLDCSRRTGYSGSSTRRSAAWPGWSTAATPRSPSLPRGAARCRASSSGRMRSRRRQRAGVGT